MSESEATAGLEESSVDGDKVKAINGMKEMEEEVKLQNGESEKPQINGDIEKSDDFQIERHESEQNEEPDDHRHMDEDGVPTKYDVMVPEKVKKIDCEVSNEIHTEKKEEVKEVTKQIEETLGSVNENVNKEKEEQVNDEEEKEKSDKEKEISGKEKEKEEREEKKEEEEEEEKKEKDEKKEEVVVEEKKEEGVVEKKVEVVVEKKVENKKEVEEVKVKESTTSDKPKSGKKSAKNNSSDDIQEVKEVPVRETRQLRVRKVPKKYTEDDDDIKITNEVIRDDSSDIEMIEESDPLAISDADVKKLQQKKKEVKTKDPNVIIIDTNTLLKNQGNLAAAVAQSSSTTVQTVTARGTSTPTAAATAVSNLNIQNAIQAITGGVPAQGLQSAYITALQQVSQKDDAYVIEAPSFIVPYVMEGKPQEPIKTFLRRINKDLEEFDRKQKEEEEKKNAEEKKIKDEKEKLEQEKKNKLEEEEKKRRLEAGEEDSKEEEAEEKKDEQMETDSDHISDDDSESKRDKESDEKENVEKESDDKKSDEKESEVESSKNKEDIGPEMDEDDQLKKDEKPGDKKETETKEKENKEIENKEKESKVKEKGKENKDKESKDKESKDKESKDKESKDKENKDKETKEKDTKEKENIDLKVKVMEGGKKKEDKETSVDDDDKENKDKSDAESVVDVEKENKNKDDLSHLGKWEPYYRSALGKFMLDLGLNQAQEFLQNDLLRMQKRKLDKMKTAPSREGILSIRMLERQLEFTREKNAHLRVPLKICKFCNFKTESKMVMDRHLESPHMVNYTYKCNFCEFETRGPQVILFHMEAEHNVRGRLERAPAFFQCALCPYEDNNKSKMTRHSFSCSKKYKPEKNCELTDWEPPAKIPKVQRGRPNTLGKAFEPVKMPSLLPKSLAGMNINIPSAVASNLLTTATAASVAAGRGRGRPVGSYKNTGPLPNQGRGVTTANMGSLLYTTRGTTMTTGTNVVQQVSGSAQKFTLANQMFHSAARVPRILPSSSASSVSLIPGLGTSSSITIQSVQSKAGNTKSPQQPSISITPLPRAGQQQTQNISKGNSLARDSSGKPSFVICEICDSYIKDLEQLRNHMNLVHKVKIHPKMIYTRPPLNCQKCQHRFFTDQGLERHLLGTHGLVTSSMQEAANKEKDAGRCPICGKVFQCELLNHVNKDHKMTLKPAHLSYKCTVCTATFNMYRLFENHVYSAHSAVNKNKGEGGKKQGSGSSDSPLKINDEITIIPQPAVRTKSDKSSGKKSEVTPTVSKEITITKVGSRPTRRSGSSVEVISLDESPSKKAASESRKRSNKESIGNGSKKARTSS